MGEAVFKDERGRTGGEVEGEDATESDEGASELLRLLRASSA